MYLQGIFEALQYLMIKSSTRQKNASETINALLIGDCPFRAAAIKEILNGAGHGFLIEEATDNCAAHNRLLERDYQLIVIDVRWSKWIEKELIAKIFRIDFHSRILFFTDCAHKDFIGGYVGCGSWGFVARSGMEASDVKKAVRAVLTNKNYISPTLLDHLVCYP